MVVLGRARDGTTGASTATKKWGLGARNPRGTVSAAGTSRGGTGEDGEGGGDVGGVAIRRQGGEVEKAQRWSPVLGTVAPTVGGEAVVAWRPGKPAG